MARTGAKRPRSSKRIARKKKVARTARRAVTARRAAQGLAPRVTGGGPILERLHTLAHNLWWTWNYDAQRLFAALNPDVWHATRNPVITMKYMAQHRWDVVHDDPVFLKQLDAVEATVERYMSSRSWFQRTYRGNARKLQVAYFCSEFALHDCLPQYSGGLGVLAGDHLKAASDLGIPLCGVGLLYRHGYYRQEFTPAGETRAVYPHYDFSEFPIADTGKVVGVPIGRREVAARIWVAMIGRTPLYLLDADISDNRPADRKLTHGLYAGGPELRMRQQVLLGVGGYRALAAVGVTPTVCHLNEGHAAFAGLERLRELIAAGDDWDDAVRKVRETNVFTTHTPVAAGHDRYDPGLITRQLGWMQKQLDLTREEFIGLGRENIDDNKEPFCMTVLALNVSEHCNGVSKLHGEVSREMWQNAYRAATPNEVPIGHVTNGVHSQTWLAPEIAPLYDKYLKPRWSAQTPEHDPWSRAERIPDHELWETRHMLRKRLMNYIRNKLKHTIARRCGNIAELIAAHETFDENVLTIGFARRFATYKRAPLIFKDWKRLAAIMNNPKRPVQLVFAGKAHPLDKPGQEFAREIFRFARKKEFLGKVVLLEDYDMQMGNMLTAGCDVWLNNPLRPREASGTSGMKPPLHGGLNCSILDGWWPEAYNRKNGWSIGEGTEFKSRPKQDRHDADMIYTLLEEEILPAFYTRGRDGVPKRWARMMKSSMKTVGQPFSCARMLGDYMEHYYQPAHAAS